MNPGIARLAIVIALVIGGVAVLANGFDDEGVAATPEPSPSQSPTGTPSPTPSPQASIVPNQKGVLVQVLNGTSRAGYAADFQEMLVDVGEYLPAGDAGDAPDKPIVDSIEDGDPTAAVDAINRYMSTAADQLAVHSRSRW